MAEKEESRSVRSVRNFFSRKRSCSDPNLNKSLPSQSHPDSEEAQAKKQNGSMVRGGSGSGSQTPPVDRKHKFSSLGRFFKPWKWKRKKKSEKFAETQRSLERKISVRANRQELVQKGILLPETPTPTSAAGPMGDAPDLLKERDHLNGAVSCSSSSPQTQHVSPLAVLAAADPSAASPAGPGPGQGQGGSGPPPPPRPDRPERPASLTASLAAASPRREYSLHQPMHQSVSEQSFSLNQLPEPPIPVSEIGPIPPPPMFSNNGGSSGIPGASVTSAVPLDLSDPSYDGLEEEEVVCGDYDDDDEDYYPMNPALDSSRVEDIPAREPRLDLKPLKSALKKHQQPASSPQQAPPTAAVSTSQSPAGRPLAVRQENSGTIRFGGGGGGERQENKENRPLAVSTGGEDSDDSDGPVLYRDDDEDDVESGVQTRLGSRVQRTDSLALKLALRPPRQELIDRNIIHVQSEQERSDWRHELSTKLNRRLSLRPTAEELEERNILKKMTQEEIDRDMEHKKVTLLRKLSFRPTVEELKQRKVIHFNDYVEVTDAHDYDRRADKPWTRLTPRDKAMIRKELNDFKSTEMDVHEDSRHLTRFHRP